MRADDRQADKGNFKRDEWNVILSEIGKLNPETKPESEFRCPFCGGRAVVKLVQHPWPGEPHGKGVGGRCENGCFMIRS
jgi:hypothetical protein